MTAVPNLESDCLRGLTSVQRVELSQVFLTSESLSNKVLCTLWQSLKAVHFEEVRHDASDPNAALQLLACGIEQPAQTTTNNNQPNNGINGLLNVETIEILRCNISRLTDSTFSGIVRTSLRFLDFSHNAIDAIDSMTFSDMGNLFTFGLVKQQSA
jgi:hypothetical protein